MSFPLIEELTVLLKENANPEIAAKQSAYMRNQFIYWGIKAPDLKQLSKEFIIKSGGNNRQPDPALIRHLWALPQREYQMVAITLMTKYAKYAPEERIHLYEEFILTKSWWDTVDMLSKDMVGVHFTRFPHLITSYNQKWISSNNIWLKRTAIIFQRAYKEKTDWDLLKKNILACTGTTEFFINKAIGWALRDYSRIAPEEVVTFIEDSPLAPLSKREGLKWLKNKGLI